MKHYTASGAVDKWDRSAGKRIEYETAPHATRLSSFLSLLALLVVLFVMWQVAQYLF